MLHMLNETHLPQLHAAAGRAPVYDQCVGDVQATRTPPGSAKRAGTGSMVQQTDQVRASELACTSRRLSAGVSVINHNLVTCSLA